MIKLIVAAIASLLLIANANAQFAGYGPAGGLYVGQGDAALPLWNPLSGDCTLSAAGLIVCTKTNGVNIYTGLPAPVNPNDAATKQYVDSTASGILIHQQVFLATASALPANTYNNGTAGVGATLTANANAALTVDGTAVATNERILVRSEGTQSHNGIYVVTATGDGSNPYVLTRAADANTAGISDPNKIGLGSYVLVTAGGSLFNTGWTVTSTVTTIGTSAIVWSQFSGAGGTALQNIYLMPQGRLTLQSGTPVMTTTQANKATIFYDCYKGGNVVAVYNGSSDVVLNINSCEISSALQNSGSGVLNTASVFDVWGVNVGGVLTLCVATNGSGGGWASDTAGSNIARGTGYSQLDTTTRAYITNKNALAHCYNGATDRGSVTANQATYLGTILTSSAGQVTWQYGTNASVAGVFGVWNAYNRVNVASQSALSTASWTHNAFSTWREAHGTTTVQTTYVYGLNDDSITASYNDGAETLTAGGLCAVAVGIDSTTAATGQVGFVQSFNGVNNTSSTAASTYHGYPGLGVHVAAGLELVIGQNCDFFGANGLPTNASYQAFSIELRM